MSDKYEPFTGRIEDCRMESRYIDLSKAENRRKFMKVPAWEMWSSDHSWGVRELDTRKLREGASIEESYSNTVWHIDMGCLPEKSDGNDAQIVGKWLKNWAWQVGVPQLLEENREVEKLRRQVHSLGRQVQSLDAALAACEQGE